MEFTRPECPLVFAQRDGTIVITESSYDRHWEAFLRLVDLELGAKLEPVSGEGRKHKHYSEIKEAPRKYRGASLHFDKRRDKRKKEQKKHFKMIM